MVMKRAVAALCCCGAARAFVGPSMTTSVGSTSTASKAAATTAETSSSAASVVARKTGNDFLSAPALERATSGNKWEKVKLGRAGDLVFEDVYEWAAAVRSGELTWEQLAVDDADIRLKWAGMFHRRKRDPGTFMMRLKVPNGIMTAEQLRFCADSVARYGPRLGVLDITTRQSLQLRGVTLEDADGVITGLRERGAPPLMSGMDNTRNIVGSPLAGLDPLELIDTRPVCDAINRAIVGTTGDSPEFANLPRKFNIAVSGSRDDFAHTHINDLGLIAVAQPDTGAVGFNVVVGGLFSAKRSEPSVPLDLWVPPEAAPALARAALSLFRDHGPRKDRTRARFMYLIDEWGVERLREEIVAAMAAEPGAAEAAMAATRAVPEPETPFVRRGVLGVRAQAQPGRFSVCVGVPAGRISAEAALEMADFAEKFSGGEVRLTVEQDVLFPNVAEADLPAARAHPLIARFPLEDSSEAAVPSLAATTVACTGATFCGFGLIVTKERAVEVARKLDERVTLSRPVRIHWTGCPNSCGQAQVGDIALMGSVAKVDGKTVEGCDIFLGGTVGEHARLAEKTLSRIPVDDEHLLPVLENLLVEHFGATKRV